MGEAGQHDEAESEQAVATELFGGMQPVVKVSVCCPNDYWLLEQALKVQSPQGSSQSRISGQVLAANIRRELQCVSGLSGARDVLHVSNINATIL